MSEGIIEFPNLFEGSIKASRVMLDINGFEIYWYGVLITLGVVLAVGYALKRSEQFGMISDNVFDIVFISAIGGFIGARAYYCIFQNLNPDVSQKYTLITAITGIRDGGLAIYGGIIGSVTVCFIYTRLRKLRILPVLDMAGLSFLIGQAIGRWGNFFNQEAFGEPTADSLPWGMTGNIIAADPAVGSGRLVHPCFLYESLWCVLGFLILHFYSKKLMSYDGEMFLLYAAWYGAGRSVIESLRTDSLYLGDLRISQLVGMVSSVTALALYIFFKLKLSGKSSYKRYRDTEESKEAMLGYEHNMIMFREKTAAVKALRKSIKEKRKDGHNQ